MEYGLRRYRRNREAAAPGQSRSGARGNGWLYLGDRVCVPGPQQSTGQGQGTWYTVKPGDTWNIIARATGIPVRTLLNANAGLVNPQLWLYVGQRVWIPAATTAGTAVTATATPTAAAPAIAATEVITPTVVVEAVPTEMPTATPMPTATAAPTATAVPTDTPEPTAVPATATPTPAAAAQATAAGTCPAKLDEYSAAVLAHLNTAGNTVESLKAWLVSCNALAANAEGLSEAALANPQSADLVLTMHDPANPPPAGRGQILVYHAGAQGYELAYEAKGAGTVALMKSGDLNGDKQADLVWTDTVCGAHTCFSTLHVSTWDGKAYQDWMEGEDPTIAAAEYKFADTLSDGTGQEITVHGGVISSAAAGPQRPWTETYISPNGGPYSLLTLEYDDSACLYHKLLDANSAFASWSVEGFEPAVEAYKGVIADQASIACGTAVKDELSTLRDFARFRLVVASVGAGQAVEAQKLVGQIKTPALAGAAKTFYDAYKASGSIIQACRDTTTYAKKTPTAWRFLADWGYANPTFTAVEFCPLD